MSDNYQELKPLNKRQQRVLDEYLICFNQWRAYKVVFPKVTDESARSLSSRLFADANFSGHVAARLNEAHMSADEALKLQADIARGDITELLTPLGSIDLDYIREKGLGRLIKKVKVRTITKIGKGEQDDDTEIHDTEIELYAADAAQERMLKVLGKLTARVDVTTNGKDLTEIGIKQIDYRTSLTKTEE